MFSNSDSISSGTPRGQRRAREPVSEVAILKSFARLRRLTRPLDVSDLRRTLKKGERK